MTTSMDIVRMAWRVGDPRVPGSHQTGQPWPVEPWFSGVFVEGAAISAAGSTCSVSLEPALRCLQAVSVFVEARAGICR